MNELEAARWKAVQQRDGSQDGVFCYGVRSTMIFCRPSCASKMPLRRNVLFFSSAEEAMAAGFRPCLRCRPDDAAMRSTKVAVRRAKTIFDAHFADRRRLRQELDALGLRQNRLIRLFREEYGVTPAAYVTSLRIAKAVELLADADRTVTEVAVSSGFGSVSSFCSSFRRARGLTPARYRVSLSAGP